MNVVDIELEKLIPYENNPRKNDMAVDKVAASIEEFGFKVPLVVGSDMLIVCGHTRYKAAVKLGLQTVPCVIADDLTDEQIKAFRLVDNKTAELAEWNVEMLEAELGEIADIDMVDFGFEMPEAADPAEDDFDVQAALDSIDEPLTQDGDIWVLGNHRLICGDCTDGAVYNKLLQGDLADLVVTDPPYNMDCGMDIDILRERKQTVNDLHPTMKPIRLLARLIKNSSAENNIVLDLFGGSGSTMIACEQVGRRCLMMEYDAKYCDVIVDRWEKFTGQKAVLLNEQSSMETQNQESLH